jgi:flagellar hook assembly protein FlgD
MSPGEHQIAWDGRDQAGRPVTPGIYFCRLQGSSEQMARKILIVR